MSRTVIGVSGQVEIVEQWGSPADLHALDPFADGPPDRSQVWWCRFEPAAIVLGSRQSIALLDAERCTAAGLDIAHRRSGGGAVVLRPDAMLWLDLVLPPGIAPDDVRGSMSWVGEAWYDALGEPGGVRVHDGGMLDTPWSDLVCFAGTGPGELFAGDRKLVGLSQRRTRHGIRVQCLVHRRADPLDDLFAIVTPPGRPALPATLADVGRGDVADHVLVGRVAAAIAARLTPV